MKYLEVTEEDIPRLGRWVAADPFHRSTIKPEFWVPPVDEKGVRVPGIKCMRVEDDNGAVFYLRLENCLRAYVQFPPEAEIDKSRMGAALRRMFFFLGGGSKKAGYHEVIFDSKSDHLIALFKLFGFEDMKDTYRAVL